MHMIYSLIPSAAVFLGHIKEQYRMMLTISLADKKFIIECSRHLYVCETGIQRSWLFSVLRKHLILIVTVLGLCGWVWVSGGYRGGFVRSSPHVQQSQGQWLQDGSTTDQGWAHQQQGWGLWENRFKEGKRGSKASYWILLPEFVLKTADVKYDENPINRTSRKKKRKRSAHHYVRPATILHSNMFLNGSWKCFSISFHKVFSTNF